MDIGGMELEGHNVVQEAIAGQSNQPQPQPEPPNADQKPQIFNLDVDCFDEIFEYLTKKDLYSFGETCTTMQQVAGEYFKRNYCAAKHGVYEMMEFDEFKTKMSLYSDGKRATKNLCRHIQQYSDDFKSLSYLRLSGIKIDGHVVKCFKPVLTKIDTLDMYNCLMDDDFYNLLKYCDNLKRLFIKNSVLGADYVPLGSGYDSEKYDSDAERPQNNYLWMNKSYPTLEYLHLWTENDYYPSWNHINAFFNRNTNIRTLSTDYMFITYNHAQLLKSEATLDTLIIRGLGSKYGTDWDLFYNTLEQLYINGFYKRLYLGVSEISQVFIDRIATLHGLEKLYLNNLGGLPFGSFPRQFGINYFIQPFPNVKELSFRNVPNQVESLIIAFKNVERLHFGYITAEELLPFIRLSRKVNKIRASFKNITITKQTMKMKKGRKRVKTITEEIPPVLNLRKWNKEREQLQGARKITIYVKDDVFLATKWACGDIDLSLIEMKRYDSCADWDDFLPYDY